MVMSGFRPRTRLVRSAILVLESPNGAYELANDNPEEGPIRPSYGDYIYRMHGLVKARFQELAPKNQWPRAHSFKSLILMLERLGLAERTRIREPSSEIIGRVKKTSQLQMPASGRWAVK